MSNRTKFATAGSGQSEPILPSAASTRGQRLYAEAGIIVRDMPYIVRHRQASPSKYAHYGIISRTLSRPLKIRVHRRPSAVPSPESNQGQSNQIKPNQATLERVASKPSS